MFRILPGLLLSAVLLGACTPSPAPQANPPQQEKLSTPNTQALSDRYACTISQISKAHATLNLLNLQNRQLQKVTLPGEVISIDGDPSQGQLYIAARTPSETALYGFNIHTRRLRRMLSFNQIGIDPIDIFMDDQRSTLYAVGIQGNRGVLFSYDLNRKGWRPLSYDIEPGILQYSQRAEHLQILHIGRQRLVHTTINTRNLQKQASNYSFSINSDTPREEGYEGQVSLNGEYFFTAIDHEIRRYRILGNEVEELPRIRLPHAKARSIALSNDSKTLYITHDQSHKISRVHFLPDGINYRIEEMPFPGEHQAIAVF